MSDLHMCSSEVTISDRVMQKPPAIFMRQRRRTLTHCSLLLVMNDSYPALCQMNNMDFILAVIENFQSAIKHKSDFQVFLMSIT